MKSITLLAFSFLFFTASFASNNFLRDTTPPNINKYTKEQFLNKYGTDETSKKLIQHYFNRRRSAKNKMLLYSGLSLLSFTGFAYFQNRSSGYVYFMVSLVLLTAGYVFGIYFLVTVFNYFRYTPKRLQNLITYYNSGNPPSKKLKRLLKKINNGKRKPHLFRWG
jgi:hypothetical protein